MRFRHLGHNLAERSNNNSIVSILQGKKQAHGGRMPCLRSLSCEGQRLLTISFSLGGRRPRLGIQRAGMVCQWPH